MNPLAAGSMTGRNVTESATIAVALEKTNGRTIINGVENATAANADFYLFEIQRKIFMKNSVNTKYNKRNYLFKKNLDSLIFF